VIKGGGHNAVGGGNRGNQRPRPGSRRGSDVEREIGAADSGRAGPCVRGWTCDRAGRACDGGGHGGSRRHLLVVVVRNIKRHGSSGTYIEGRARRRREIRLASRHDDDVVGPYRNRISGRAAERTLAKRALDQPVRAVALAVTIEVDERLARDEGGRAVSVVEFPLIEERLGCVLPRLWRAVGEIVIRIGGIPRDRIPRIENTAAGCILEAFLADGRHHDGAATVGGAVAQRSRAISGRCVGVSESRLRIAGDRTRCLAVPVDYASAGSRGR